MTTSGNQNSLSPEHLEELPYKVADIPYKVIGCYPHDERAFTEGLVFHEGTLYESTGTNPGTRSISTLRQVEIGSGRVLRARAVSKGYFAEGLAILHGKAYQLTYLDDKGLVYDLETLTLLNTFSYEYQGWGLTNDGKCLIMSDGSNHLRYINPCNLEVEGEPIMVTICGQALYGLNELEYIAGRIYANVFETDYIFRIDPNNGKVTGRMDLKDLHPKQMPDSAGAVLNGIAFDNELECMFVTGKYWPTLFEIQIKDKPASDASVLPTNPIA
ncbi:MAG TPA: glutaminyl-peptide cyclotransferase [Pyrinomonadaceae bacterium]|nr:glutaminyl-peptide cyclotransferase [Pyrinomonadaceae bacterium]